MITALLFALVIVCAAAAGQVRPAAALASCETGQAYHHDVTVDANGFARSNKPAEIKSPT